MRSITTKRPCGRAVLTTRGEEMHTVPSEFNGVVYPEVTFQYRPHLAFLVCAKDELLLAHHEETPRGHLTLPHEPVGEGEYPFTATRRFIEDQLGLDFMVKSGNAIKYPVRVLDYFVGESVGGTLPELIRFVAIQIEHRNVSTSNPTRQHLWVNGWEQFSSNTDSYASRNRRKFHSIVCAVNAVCVGTPHQPAFLNWGRVPNSNEYGL
jgi:hypothetical protein